MAYSRAVLVVLAACFVSVHSQNCPDQIADNSLSCDYLNGSLFNNCNYRGDPHATTFDGKRYRFSGHCTFTLVQFCDGGEGGDDNEDRPRFSIEGIFRERQVNNTQSVADGVIFKINGFTYKIEKDSRTTAAVEITNDEGNAQAIGDGQDVNNVETVDIRSDSTNFAFRLYNEAGQLLVRIEYSCKFHLISIFVRSEDYNGGLLCGMCGIYNGDSEDDLSQTNTVGGSGNGSDSEPSDDEEDEFRRRKRRDIDYETGDHIQDFGKRWEARDDC